MENSGKYFEYHSFCSGVNISVYLLIFSDINFLLIRSLQNDKYPYEWKFEGGFLRQRL